jgi:hypothetical protein
MKKLHTFSFGDRPLATMYRELLANEGIACLVRNDQLSSALGEIPFIECYPELWVIDDEVLPRAQILLHGWLRASVPVREGWFCPECGECHEGQFNQCWSCGRLRD